jgi:GNAT superfamily N-acetyltransferase
LKTNGTLRLSGGSIIATLPDYQGQGHGRRLVESGLKMADTEGKTWYAGCWPASVPLYKKVGGFDYVTEESIDMSRHGGEGVVSMRLFVRKPNVTTI